MVTLEEQAVLRIQSVFLGHGAEDDASESYQPKAVVRQRGKVKGGRKVVVVFFKVRSEPVFALFAHIGRPVKVIADDPQVYPHVKWIAEDVSTTVRS